MKFIYLGHESISVVLGQIFYIILNLIKKTLKICSIIPEKNENFSEVQSDNCL